MLNRSTFQAMADQQLSLITASNRQSRYWVEQYHRQQSQVAGVWPGADVLPITAWLNRLFFACARNTDAPILLNANQSLSIWQQVLEQSDAADYLISVKATARKVQDAFQILNRWNVALTDVLPNTEDHEAFIRWAKDYQSRLNHMQAIDASQLPEWLTHYFSQLNQESADSEASLKSLLKLFDTELNSQLLLLGFHQMEPGLQQLFKVLMQCGLTIREVINSGETKALFDQPSSEKNTRKQTRNPKVMALSCQSFEQELLHACDWSIRRLTANANAKLAIVVPDLEKRRYQVEALLKQQLHPELLSECEPEKIVYNISVGLPLTNFGMVRIALNLLELMAKPVELSKWAEILRSQCFKLEAKDNRFNVSDEFYWRLKQFAFELPAEGEETTSFESMTDRIQYLGSKFLDEQEAQVLAGAFISMKELIGHANKEQSAEAWSQLFINWLKLWGWPGTSSLTSYQYQLRDQLLSLIKQLRQFNILGEQCHFKQAFSWLRSLLEGAVFQPKSKGEPIQVMGLYEAVGLEFDALWICCLSNEVLPEAANPNPFIPLSLARQHQLPGSGPERELEYANTLIDGLLATSDNVAVSYHKMDQDRELSPSPLILQRLSAHGFLPADIYNESLSESIEQTELSWQSSTTIESSLRQLVPPEQEYFVDDYGQPYQETQLKSGNQFLTAQALCPMQGYLAHRVGLMEQEVAVNGMDPRTRGVYVHKVMQVIWQRLVKQSTLLGSTDDELKALINRAIIECADDRFSKDDLIAQLEKEKFSLLIFDLLQLEKKRQSFTVTACELEKNIVVNGLSIQSRIDRIDHVDDYGDVIIDYKTGQVNANKWYGDRIAEPQLPLYLMADHQHVSAICFAQLHHKKVSFSGVAKENGILPGVPSIEKAKTEISDWQSFIYYIESELETLTDEIKQGYAAVKPNEKQHACDYCPFDSVCRVAELDAGEFPDDSSTDVGDRGI